jgi:sulfonate transport system ATP-binding protein
VLIVTHDVDEAVLLADRVLALRDGAISLDVPITLRRPRSRSTPEFLALRERLLGLLGVPELVASAAGT